MKTITQRFVAVLLATMIGICMASAQTKTVKHTVERGETLASIAKRYGTTDDKIIEFNPDASQFIYVGMELTIPVTLATDSTESNVNQYTNDHIEPYQSSNDHSTKNTSETYNLDDSFELERKNGAFEISYCASTFKDVKQSGSYGMSWTSLPWKIAPRLYIGYHFSPFNFNFGLVDSSMTSDVIKLGPAVGYYLTPKTFVAMPLDIICDVYFDSDNKTKTAWGMSLAPTIYVGSKGGIFLGPQFTVGFSEGSEVVCGFRAGVYF